MEVIKLIRILLLYERGPTDGAPYSSLKARATNFHLFLPQKLHEAVLENVPKTPVEFKLLPLLIKCYHINVCVLITPPWISFFLWERMVGVETPISPLSLFFIAQKLLKRKLLDQVNLICCFSSISTHPYFRHPLQLSLCLQTGDMSL